MLICKVNLRISTSYSRPSMGSGLARILRLSRYNLCLFIFFCKLFVFCVLIDLPSVASALYFYRIAIRSCELLRLVFCIVFVRQFFNILLDIIFIEGYLHFLFINLNPLRNYSRIHHLCLRTEFVSNLGAKITIHLVRSLGNFL